MVWCVGVRVQYKEVISLGTVPSGHPPPDCSCRMLPAPGQRQSNNAARPEITVYVFHLFLLLPVPSRPPVPCDRRLLPGAVIPWRDRLSPSAGVPMAYISSYHLEQFHCPHKRQADDRYKEDDRKHLSSKRLLTLVIYTPSPPKPPSHSDMTAPATA